MLPIDVIFYYLLFVLLYVIIDGGDELIITFALKGDAFLLPILF